MRVKPATAAVLVFAFAAGYSSGQNPTLETAMRTKLLNAQPLLEAVVTADVAAIGRSADALPFRVPGGES